MPRRSAHSVVTVWMLVCPLILMGSASIAQSKDWCSIPVHAHHFPLSAQIPALMTRFHADLEPWDSHAGADALGFSGFGQILCTLSPREERNPMVPPPSATHHQTHLKTGSLPTHEIVNEDPMVLPPAEGFGYPMSHMKTIRGFDGAKCRHQGLDIYEDDEYFGTGKPIYAITRAEVTFIGTPEKNRRVYGRRDRRAGTVKRGRKAIPRRMNIEPYGTVYPFTRNHGRARTGVFLVTKSLHPRYPEHLIRYMHLTAIHPDLEVGDIIETGQEVGLMGSTAVMSSIPHLHLDMETPKGLRVNPAPLIGLSKMLPSKCKALTRAQLIRLKRRHVVRRGDSLWKISRKYKTTVKRLKRLNRIRRGQYLQPGQKLRVR